MKYTILGNDCKDKWEYRCNQCGQLRFSYSVKEPTQCGNCESKDITTGQPGTLPEQEKDYDSKTKKEDG